MGMIASLPRLLLVRFWAVLLLATVGLQASLPGSTPLERTHGSAFSATTAEVALAPHRRAVEAAKPVAPDPRVPSVAPQPPLHVLAVERPQLPLVRPSSIGPPAFPPLPSRAAPRAPPHA